MAEPDRIDEQAIIDPGPVISTVESWRGAGADLAFDASDLDLLDLVLSVAPDLRAVAYLGKITRQRGLEYPVPSVATVAAILGDEQLEVGEFILGADDVVAALGPELFPLVHEGELLSAIHLALQRCRVQSADRWQRAIVECGPGNPEGVDPCQ